MVLFKPGRLKCENMLCRWVYLSLSRIHIYVYTYYTCICIYTYYNTLSHTLSLIHLCLVLVYTTTIAIQELDLWVEGIDRQDGVVMTTPNPGQSSNSSNIGLDTTSGAMRSSRVQRTKVCHETCDPHWDMELIFPLQTSSLEDILEGK